MGTIELEAQLPKLYSCEYAQNWIGLESQIIFEMKRTIRSKRSRLYNHIYALQMELEFCEDPEVVRQEMAEFCFENTRSSCLLAQWLAWAQEQEQQRHHDDAIMDNNNDDEDNYLY